MARHRSGELLTDFLAKIQEYLSSRTGHDGEAGLAPVVTSYLTSFLSPTLGQDLSLRNSGELRTLAAAMGMLLKGDTVAGLEVLVQRFKAIELVAGGESWDSARHLELAPTGKVSTISEEERRHIAKAERRETQTATQLAALRGSGKRRH
jgi:hypothetical protein